MKRYVKVLAASTLLGFQAIPGYVGVATAQSVLPHVTVSRSCPSVQVQVYQDRNFLGCGNVSDYSSGGGSGGGSIPEGEAIVNGRWAPAPPPEPVKTEEQRERDRARCDTNRAFDFSVFQTGISGQVARCGGVVSSGAGWLYFIETVKTLRGRPCGVEIAKETDKAARIIQGAHDVCMAKANQP